MRFDEDIERGDPDTLTRAVDGLCATRDWDGLVELRDRCVAAVQRGKQLWGVSAHIEYRLALEAPSAFAGAVVVPGAGRFALGPLPEVAASTHTWAELAPFLSAGPLRAVTAHERVVRGERVADDSVDPHVLELPFAIQEWEPDYPVAVYRADGAEFPAPDGIVPTGATEALPPAGAGIGDNESERALVALAEVWVAESDGRAAASAVRGDAPSAIAALGPARARLTPVPAQAGIAAMAWAAASGGAHGRRRGAAAGRFGAWWALTAIGGMLEDWPVAADELGELATALTWFAWDVGEPETGWSLRLAIHDPAEGLAFAVAAVDST